MPTQDTSKIKENIISTLRRRGPCLPVHIASEIGTSILFASAFLSELVSEKKIRMSYMKVGSSPIYLIPGQEPLLEKFAQYLRSKERDAFELLKKNRFLVDSKQEPAIRVALRSIKDFAIPFNEKDELIWKYHTEKSSGVRLSAPIVHPKQEPEKKEIPEEKSMNSQEIKERELGIFENEKKESTKKTIKKSPAKKTSRKKSAYDKKNERFFNKVKEFLEKKSIQISDIEGFSKSDLILKVIDGGVEKILVAYNKKRITESEITKAYKKASEENLPYLILSLGEPSKKLMEFVRAIRNLSKIYKIGE